MIKTLCTICARYGSKRLPGKNVRDWFGVPLIRHTVKQAFEYGFDHIVVSSDHQSILNAANVPKENRHFRPEYLATDLAEKIAVLQNIAKNYNVDIIIDLAVTSPLRTVDDIKKAMELFNGDRLTSVYEQDFVIHTPEYAYVYPEKDTKHRYSKRKILNGAINIWSKETLFGKYPLLPDSTQFFIMPKWRSIDIDTKDDFEIAEMIYAKQLEEK